MCTVTCLVTSVAFLLVTSSAGNDGQLESAAEAIIPLTSNEEAEATAKADLFCEELKNRYKVSWICMTMNGKHELFDSEHFCMSAAEACTL